MDPVDYGADPANHWRVMMSVSKSIAAAAVVLALGASVAHAQEGTATGTFTVNGKATKLAYAYATAEPDSSDKTKEIVRVTLSDVKLTPKQLEFPFGLKADTKAGKVHAVVAEIKATKKVLNTMLYDQAFGMDLVSIAGESNLFEGTLDAKTAEGKLHRSGPGDTNNVKYDFSVTFKAPIQRAGK
jgi:hypothetical protein